MRCTTLKVGETMRVGALLLTLEGVRGGAAALRTPRGIVILGWPGDGLEVGALLLKIKRVQPSRVTVCVESDAERVGRV